MSVVLRDFSPADAARVDQLALEAWEQYRDRVPYSIYLLPL